tara:strand:+ start:322 stop:858 length:537 start_codon:yes stop_codon:yes gene_type:complete
MKININKIKTNTKNPRIIKDNKFKQLVKSIKDFPEMLEKRPIVVDDQMIILGGNMRLKACQEAGLKQVDILIAKDWTEDQKQEFIIKDNIGFGEWDWDSLANGWESEKLNEWGLDVWKPEEDLELEDFFNETDETEDDIEKHKITLEYNEEDYNTLINILDKEIVGKEKIIYDLIVNK